MSPETPKTPPTSGAMFWIGVVLSALCVLGLIASGSMKIIQPTGFADDFTTKMGFSLDLAPKLAVLEISCALIYAIPRTSVLGAILLTGYLGGAVVTHVRAGDGMFFAPAIFGIVVWLALFLRNARLRALIPIRS